MLWLASSAHKRASADYFEYFRRGRGRWKQLDLGELAEFG
jgi:hypothetical protein